MIVNNFSEVNSIPKEYTLKYELDDNVYVIVRKDGCEYFLNNKSDVSQLVAVLNDNIKDLKRNDTQILELEERMSKYQDKVLQYSNRVFHLENKIKRHQRKLIDGFPISAEPIKSPYRLVLKDYFKIPENPSDKIWYEQEIFEALKYYKTDKVKILKSYRKGDYQGEYFAELQIEDYFFLWRGDFGSCDVCDMIANQNIEEGYETLLTTLTEGNTLQFYNKTHAMNYIKALKESKRYNYWQNYPIEEMDNGN